MTNTANIDRLTTETVTREALALYVATQDWTIGSLHATDAERALARYRKAAAHDALDLLTTDASACTSDDEAACENPGHDH